MGVWGLGFGTVEPLGFSAVVTVAAEDVLTVMNPVVLDYGPQTLDDSPALHP